MSVRDKLRANMRAVFDLASHSAAQVFMFVTPVHTPAVNAAGHDRESIEKQLAFARSSCIEMARDRCIDTSIFDERRDMYLNLTHLNQAGHRAFAAQIEAALAASRR